MTLMYDSVNAFNIPVDAPMVAGYVDGPQSQWSSLEWARFENTPKRLICVDPRSIGDTADVEHLDFNPGDVPGWARRMLNLGKMNLWVYCNLGNRVATEDLLWAAGFRLDQISMWIATLDGRQNVAVYRYPIAAVQYIDVGPYDLSIVYQVFGPESGSIGDDMATQQEIIAAIEATGLKGGVTSMYNELVKINDLLTQLVNKPSGGGSGESSEPTTVVLEIPAQTISGKLS